MNTRQYPSPPRWAQAVLSVACSREERPFLLGDMEEEFHRLCHRRSITDANSWYRSQALKSLTPLYIERVIRLLSAPAFIGSLIGSLVAVIFAIALSCGLLPFLIPQAMLDAGKLNSVFLALIQLTVVTTSAALAGAAATFISHDDNPLGLVMICLVLVLPQLVLATLGHQPWTVPLVGFVTAMLGAWIGARVISAGRYSAGNG